MHGEGGGVDKWGDCKQVESRQVGCTTAPPLPRQHFYLPGIVLISAPGHIYPRTESLVRKSLEMGVVKGLFKIKMTRKIFREYSEEVPASLCKNKQMALACKCERCLYAHE